MSVETITIVLSAVALLVTIGGTVVAGFGWMIRQMNEGLDRLEQRLSARIDATERELGGRIDVLQREMVEVKIGIARLEGPPRRLLTAR